MSVINLAKTLKGKSGWVSIAPNHKKVIAQSRNLKGLLKKLKEMGNPDGYIMIAADDFSNYVG